MKKHVFQALSLLLTGAMLLTTAPMAMAANAGSDSPSTVSQQDIVSNDIAPTITATAGPGGTIEPSGIIPVTDSAERIFRFTPSLGYAIDNVYIDGVAQGVYTAVSFSNVTTNRSVSVTFKKLADVTLLSMNSSRTFQTQANAYAWYAFTAPNKGTYVFSSDGSLDTTGSLYQSQPVASSSNFVGSDSNSGTNNNFSMRVNMNADQTLYLRVSATTAGSYSLNVSPASSYYTITASVSGGGGTISPSGSVTVDTGTNKSFVITPYEDYRLSNVKVDGVDKGAITNFTFQGVTQNHTLVAYFTKIADVTPLSMNVNTSGSISANNPYVWYSFTAPSAGTYIFKSSGSLDIYGEFYSSLTDTRFAYDDDSGENRNFQKYIQLTAGQKVYMKVLTTAASYGSFSVNVSPLASSYSITASAGSGGIIFPSGTVSVPTGGSQTFTISPSVGYAVKTVLIDGVAEAKPALSYNFTGVSSSHTISVTFEKVADYTALQLNKPLSGSVGNGSYTWYAFTAVKGGTYNFSTSGSTDTYGELYTSMTANRFGYDDDNGENRNFSMNCTITEGQTVFLKVRGYNASTGGSYTVAVTEVGAVVNKYTISSSAGTGGSISPAGSTTVNQGATQSYSITPSTGYEIDNVTVDGASRGKVTSYTFSNITANHTISVTFKKTETVTKVNVGQTYSATLGDPTYYWYSFTAPSAGNYIFQTTGSTDTYGELYTSMTDTMFAKDDDSGENRNFSIVCTLSANQTIYLKVRGYSTNTKGAYSLTVTREATERTITATAGKGGSITPSGATTVKIGGTQAYTIKPDAGYSIEMVKVDGKDTQAYTTYTFTNVQENHTIEATFKADPTATALTLNIEKSGKLESGATVWYSFKAPSAGTYVFQSTGSVDTIGGLYSSVTDTNALASNDDGGEGRNFMMSYTMSTDQTIYLKLTGYRTASGDYSVSVKPNMPAETPKLTVNTPVSGELTANKACWYSFTAPSAGTYTFQSTGSLDTYGELYTNMNSTALQANDDGGENRNFKLSYEMTANQTVYLKLRGYSTNTAGSFGVSVTSGSGDATDVQTLALDNAQSGTISAGSYVWYRFTAPSTGTYMFTANSSIDTYGELYSNMTDSTSIAYNDDSGTNRNFLIQRTLNAGQVVYLKVRGYSSSVHGSFTVTATR